MCSGLSRAVLGGLLALAAAACSDPAPQPPDGRYTVRAEIVKLPTPPSREVYLRHESIPGFRDLRGRHTGMASMTMPFHLDEAIDATTLAVGERVEVDFEVRWNDRAPLRVVRAAPLAPGTRLEFDPPPQPAAPAEAGAADESGSTPR